MVSQDTIQRNFFFGFLAIVTVTFVLMLKSFVIPIFWAAALAILFNNVNEKVCSRLKGRRSLAAVSTLVLILVTVILPLFLVAVAVINEATPLFQRVQSGEIDIGAAVRWVQTNAPRATAAIERVGFDLNELRNQLSSAAVQISKTAAGQAINVGQNLARFLFMISLMIYMLFFFLRDGHVLTEMLVRVLPLGDARERELFSRFAIVSRAALKGTLVVGAVQGTLGGIMFALLGIEAAVFWGVIMTLLSLLPAVGAIIVWAPAAAILIANGDVEKGLILIAFGFLVVGLVDNVLRPVMVGRETRMPDYLVLLATLGGIVAFGLSGFVVGPVIAAMFLAVWGMFEEEYGDVPTEPAKGTPEPAPD